MRIYPVLISIAVSIIFLGFSFTEVSAQYCTGSNFNSSTYYCETEVSTGCQVCRTGVSEECDWVGGVCRSKIIEGESCRDYNSGASCNNCYAVNQFISYTESGCDSDPGGWPYIYVTAESGNLNFPGRFILTAREATTVSWAVACAYAGDGCERDPEWGSYTFEKDESIMVGWGHVCHSWQLDPVGRAGFIAEAEPWLCTVPTPASCEIDAHDIAFNGVGDSQTTVPSIDPTKLVGGNIVSVEFTVANPSVVGITSTNPDTIPSPFSAEMASLLVANTTYTVTASMDDADSSTCVDTANITVDAPSAWCQFLGGSAMANGTISCSVPVDPPGLFLMTDIIPNYPGIPIAGGTVQNAPGQLSSTNWSAEGMTYGGILPTYLTFKGKAPATMSALGNTADQTTLTNGGTQFPSGSGYYYYIYSGGAGYLLLQDGSGVIDIGTRKVIVFADSNVNINSKIQVDNGLGFFMLIASGNIIINPSVKGSQEDPPIPDLEGVYYADGSFRTGTSGSGADEQLHVRGVVVANQVVLERSNTVADEPGEIFEYGPDQSMMIPSDLSKRVINWRELSP